MSMLVNSKEEHILKVYKLYQEISMKVATSMIEARISNKLRVPQINKAFSEATKELITEYLTLAWQKADVGCDIEEIVGAWLQEYDTDIHMQIAGMCVEDFREVAIEETRLYIGLRVQRNGLLAECRQTPVTRKTEYTWDDAFNASREEVEKYLTYTRTCVGYTTFVTDAIGKMIVDGIIKPGLIGTALHDLLKKELGQVYTCNTANFVNKAMKANDYKKGAYTRKKF